MTPGASCVALSLVAGAALCLACGSDTPTEPSRQGPRLLSPAPGVRFRQNDPAIGCAAHPTAGYGHGSAFDWSDVPGAAEYRIVYVHAGHLPLYDRTVPTSDFAESECGSYVDDLYLDGWSWRVAALMPVVNGARDTLWSESRVNGFEPCRLVDGRPCH
jgi:hypothetical protein